MRVAFVASTLAMGGAERITGEASERLVARGHEVVWLLLREPGLEGERLLKRGMVIESGLGHRRFDPFTPGRLAARLEAHGVEAVWCLDHQNAVVNLALASRRSPIMERLFLAVHTTGLWGGGSSVPRGVRAVLPIFTNVIAVAEAQRRYLVDGLGMLEGQVVVVRNGIDVSRFSATLERTTRAVEFRRSWAGASTGPIVGVIAALRPEKGHIDLIDVLATNADRLGSVHLVLVGDGPMRKAIEKRAAGRNVRVHFLGARSDVADLLPAFDLVVLPSRPVVETLPLSVMEAMAAGRPVVATRVGALDELIEDGVSGWLVPPLDPAALADRLVACFGDPGGMTRIGRNAAERARSFDIETTVDAMARLLTGPRQGLL
ncbi:MAG: glycosyltransferase family 4 protein [Candidatus Eisenbacteria bacterium]|nr:glycosyltransferase family 4 protein [Candidatus Eisenbacteria bacterium]